MSFINNTSFMKLVSGAWERACEILHEHDHVTRPPDVEVLFMEELYKLDHDISHIVAMIYSNYCGTKSELDELKDEHDQYKKHFELIQRVKKHLKKDVKELEKLNATQVELSNDLLDQREVLESSLNTSRFFIFMSGMCGFVLGLACLYLVV